MLPTGVILWSFGSNSVFRALSAAMA